MTPDEILNQLVGLTRTLGDPALDYAILGEGNTAARADAGSFWVKASGAEMATIDATGFVRVRTDGVLSLLEMPDFSDEQVRARIDEAKVDPLVTARPSVETVLHAVVLAHARANFVGHTHPTAVNAVLCSQQAEAAYAGRLFPDEIVYCGPAPIYVPYTDPGLPLARKVRDELVRTIRDRGEAPKLILLQNHGLIGLGATAREVENVTAMAVKTARVLLGTYVLGGPCFLSPQAVARIHTRPDEVYRRQEWADR